MTDVCYDLISAVYWAGHTWIKVTQKQIKQIK